MSLISNNRILHDYEVLERIEAGIELLGHEVKSIRASHGSLQGAYITVSAQGNSAKATLSKAFIPPYQEKNTEESYDPYRNRNLLLKRAEIVRLSNKLSSGKSGLTIVPISMYNKGRVIKLEMALVRGKKLRDKRETLKKRQTDREIAREWKDR
jgi:SsrA-binding protein